MSDSFPPPPPGSNPPPPPPDLTAPPGYSGYQATPMASVPLRRIGGISKAAAALVAIGGVVSLAAIAATRAVTDDAEAYLVGDTTDSEFLSAIAPYALLSFVQVFALVAAAVVVIVWMYRIAGNLRALHRGTTWGPGWAVGGWFVPPFLFVIPFLVLREMWKASDPQVPVGGDWRSNPTPPTLTAWFVVFGPIQALLQFTQLDDTFAGLGSSEQALAEQITGDQTMATIGALTQLVAAVLFVLVVRGLTDRHRRLTGEHRS